MTEESHIIFRLNNNWYICDEDAILQILGSICKGNLFYYCYKLYNDSTYGGNNRTQNILNLLTNKLKYEHLSIVETYATLISEQEVNTMINNL